MFDIITLRLELHLRRVTQIYWEHIPVLSIIKDLTYKTENEMEATVECAKDINLRQ